jgi:hypothetical protein
MSVTIRGTDTSAAAPSFTGTDGDTGMFFPAADTIAFAEGGAESMRLNSAGNVGIGTASPTTKLHVVSAADGQISTFIGGSSSNITVGIFGSTTQGFGSIGTRTNNGFNIYSNDVDRIRIDSAGRVNMPFQPMFSGHRNNGNIAAGSVVIINTPDIDVGNNYNYGNGRFTCPITGVYEVHTCGHSENSAPSQLRIAKNGVTVKQEYQNGAAYGTTPVTIIMNCNAGDYIESAVVTGAYWGSDITGVRLTIKLVA